MRLYKAHFPVLFLWVAIGFLSSASSAAASSEEDLTHLDIDQLLQVKVYSASRHWEEAKSAPSSVSIIGAEEIRRYGWRTVADVFNSVRGFYTSYDRNYTYLGVRGFAIAGDYNTRILVLINGHRLNDNLYGQAQIGTEFSLDLDLVERIEIVRGPSSSLFGTNAIFGVINIITRSTGSAFEFSSDGSSQRARTFRLTGNLRKGAVKGIVSASIYRSNGNEQLYFPEFDSAETNSGIAQSVDADRHFRLFSDTSIGNLRVQGLLAERLKIVPTAPYLSMFNQPSNRTLDTRGYLEASYSRSFASKTDLQLRTYYDAYRFDGTFAFNPLQVPSDVWGEELNTDSAADFPTIIGTSQATADWMGVEGTIGHNFGSHRITAGALTEYNFRIDQWTEASVTMPTFFDHRNPWLVATFVNAELRPIARLTLQLGGRLDWFDYFRRAWSPRTAAIFALNPNVTLKYVFGRAFRAPNAYESFYSDGISAIAPATMLKMENIESHEVVLEHDLRPWLRTSFVGYHNSLRNTIEQTADAEGIPQFENDGADRSRGVGLEIEAKRRSGLTGRISYNLSEVKENGHTYRIPNSPLHTAKVNTVVPFRSIYVGLELQSASAQSGFQGARIPPSFLTNATVSTRPLKDAIQLSLSCYNLFDRSIFAPAGPSLRQSMIRQDGRTLRLKVIFRFSRESSNP